MKDRAPKNLTASIHQRLLNAAKKAGRPFNDVAMYYAIELFFNNWLPEEDCGGIKKWHSI